MSWPSWQANAAPLPGVGVVPSTVLSSTINSAPTVLPPAGAGGMHYTPEQWAQVQQQNWQQWAQWQQQYQQWHQQYGAEYQKSMSALATTGPPPMVPVPNTSVPPPPPNENKPPPPPPPDDHSQPPSQFPVKPGGYSTVRPPPNQQFGGGVGGAVPQQPRNQPHQNQWQSANKRPFPQAPEYEANKRQMLDNQGQWNRPSQAAPSQPTNQWPNVSSAPVPNQTHAQKVLNLEELTEAEKKFDKEFAAWEAQFNKWKEQNSNHPDKTQYMEYEKKWESWRNSLLERREQMRKKRLAMLASMATTAPPPIKETLPPPISNEAVAPNSFLSKPPPTLNNEPLAFKPPKSFPGNSVPEKPQGGGGEGFLQSSFSSSGGGIPGLDLVKEGKEVEDDADDVIISEGDNQSKPVVSKGPDLEAISKGINSILGDPKLLNMLSLVSQKQNLTTSNIVDTPPPQLMNTKPPIPSLLDMPPISRSFEQSSQSYEEYPEQYNSGLPTESVNNFDDQTRMSFTNGPNEPEGPYGGHDVAPRFGGGNRSNFAGKFGDGRQPNRFDRNNSFDDFQDRRGYRNGQQRGNNRNFNRNDYDDNYGDYDQGYNDGRNNNYGRNEENWNEDEDYDKYHEMFNEAEHSADAPPLMEEANGANEENAPAVPPEDEEPLFVPQLVIDYEHKPLKPVEPEVSLNPIYMFDYRNKPVNRIPYPQRPIWLSGTLRNIMQFDPMGAGRYLGAQKPVLNYEKPPPEERVTRTIEPTGGGRYTQERDFSRYERRDRDDYGYNRDRSRAYKDSPERERSKNNPPKPTYEAKKLDLEELSDDEWVDDDVKIVEPPKQTLKFSPPRRNLERRAPANPPPATSNRSTPLEDLINNPGRRNRPSRMVIILRGPPGSGKTYLAKLIKDREVENGGSAPRILSLDDYFMVEQEKCVFEDGNLVRIKEMVYEYEADMEESYRQSLTKAFKKTITDGYFNFIIVDNVNQKVRNFGEMWSYAKQNGFQVYICQMDMDPQQCTQRNVHNRTQKEIEDCIAGWEPTPPHHPQVDATNFLQSTGPITEVEMEEVDLSQDSGGEDAVEGQVRSKWDSFDCSVNNLARLDGVNKPLRSSHTMEEYLQLDDEIDETVRPTKPGQKRVRWADLEEQKQQKRMKALGFVVGHTDWNRMMDPSHGESALTQTKYIERVGRY